MQFRIQRVQWIESHFCTMRPPFKVIFDGKTLDGRGYVENWWENFEISLLLNEEFFSRLLLWWCTSTSSYLHNLAPLPRLWEGFLLSSSSATYSFVFANLNVFSLVKIFEVDMILWQIWPCNNFGRKTSEEKVFAWPSNYFDDISFFFFYVSTEGLT